MARRSRRRRERRERDDRGRRFRGDDRYGYGPRGYGPGDYGYPRRDDDPGDYDDLIMYAFYAVLVVGAILAGLGWLDHQFGWHLVDWAKGLTHR